MTEPVADTLTLMAALATATRANVEMAANLAATQARCTELLDAERAAKREIKILEGAVKAARREMNAMIDQCHDLSVKVEAVRAAASERQAQTIQRLRAVGYRVVKRYGACVSLTFTRG
jgi:tRNA A37 N6-isopentenylltransferase MiaA